MAQGTKPHGLAAPRGGKADELELIRGIGPQNEARLHALGVFHFDQIAAWTAKEAQWVGGYLAFPGRIEREDWIGQARSPGGGGDDRPRGACQEGRDFEHAGRQADLGLTPSDPGMQRPRQSRLPGPLGVHGLDGRQVR
jgi:hypothetical protein